MDVKSIKVADLMNREVMIIDKTRASYPLQNR
jgi:hypothetical protein